MVIQFIVYGINRDKMTIDVCEKDYELLKVTVLELKKKIARRLPGDGAAMSDMMLIFADERLEEDNKPLAEYGLIHRSTIQMVMLLPGGLTTQQRHWMDPPPQVP